MLAAVWSILKSARFLALLVLVTDISLTIFAWQYALEQSRLELREYFMFRVREAQTLTENRLLAQEQVLRGTQSLFLLHDNVTRDQFKHHINNLRLDDYYPGIQGVGFISLVQQEYKDQHINYIRETSGQSNYLIRPETERLFYAPIVYLEPQYGKNLRRLGFDMLTDPIAEQAMQKARDTGNMTISHRILHDNKQVGFYMFLPVYNPNAPQGNATERRSSLIGWVYSSFVMSEFALGMYGEQASDLRIEIYDGEAMSPDGLLYDSTNGKQLVGAYPMWHVQPVYSGQQIWSLVARSQPSLETRVNVQRANWVLGIGLAASVLFSVLTWLLFSGRDRANAYASAQNAELVQRTQELHESEIKLKALLNASEVAIMWESEEGEIEYVNSKFIVLFGYTLEEVPTIAQWYLRAFPNPEYRQQVISTWRQKVKDSLPLRTPVAPVEVVICCRDGSMRNILIVGSWADAKLLSTFSDLTWRKHAEEDLRKLSIAVEQSPVVVVITDVNANIEYVNPRFTEVTGYTLNEVIGRNPNILKSGQTPAEVYVSLWSNLQQGLSWSGELLNRRKNGDSYWEEISIAPVKNALGQVTHYVAVKNDITERKHQEHLIKQLAHYDALTQLPNRTLFGDRFRQAIAMAKRDQSHFAIMFIDLDKFKPVNDTLGHHIGDLVLIEVANRILGCIRESDTAARLGGDEFVILLIHVEHQDGVLQVAEKVRQTLEMPFMIQEHKLQLGSSIGVAIFPEHGKSERELTHNADMAMYHAKEHGRNCVVLFHEDLE